MIKPVPPHITVKPAQIKALRRKLGLSQEKTAIAIGEFTDCSQQAVADWETGKSKIPRYVVFFLRLLVDRSK